MSQVQTQHQYSQLSTKTSQQDASGRDAYYQYDEIEKYFYKIITPGDVKRNNRLAQQILNQCNFERLRSRQAVLRKRELISEWLKKLKNPDAGVGDRVKSFVCLQQLKAFIATFHDSEMTVSFTGREFSDDDLAYAIEKLAAYDHQAMKKSIKDHPYLFSVGLTGTGLRIRDGFDEVKQLPRYKVLDSRYWYPDPMGNIYDGYRYHGFDGSITKVEMEQINLRSRDEVYYDFRDLAPQINVDFEINKATEAALTNTDTSYERLGQIQLHNWYTQLGMHKYLVTCAGNFNRIIRFCAIEPIDATERAHPELVSYGINVGQIFPLIGDPMGMGLVELIIDFQNAKNRLLNLLMVKEERAAGYSQFLVDMKKLGSNLSLLEKRSSDGPTYIPVNAGDRGLDGAVVPVASEPVGETNSMSVMQKFDSEVEQVGFTSIARGVSPQGAQTAAEAKILQSNNNLLFGLDADMLAEGEADFRQNIWFRGLKQYMTGYQKKWARIGNGMLTSTYEITHSDLVSMQDPDISVESKKVRMQRDKEILTFLASREQAVMVNPDIPKISKIMYRRDIEAYAGLPREKIYRNNPRTCHEDRALIYCRILNKMESIKEMYPEFKIKNFFEPGMDYFTYYIYITSCKKSEERDALVRQLRKKIIDEGMQKELQALQGMPAAPNSPLAGVANSMTSQQTSNFMKQQEQPDQAGSTMPQT